MRHLYLLFVAAFLVTLAGFWPSFYSASGGLDPFRLLHGGLATTWSLMLIAQTWAIGRRHRRFHRVVGWSSVAVAPALLLSSLWVVHLMLSGQGKGGAPFAQDLRLTLALGDLISLVQFAALWGLAIVYRKRWALHGRLMGATALIVLPPALGRLIGMNLPGFDLQRALPWSYAIPAAILVALIVRDAAHRRFLAPYPLTLASFAIAWFAMQQAPHWAWFRSVAHMMGLP